MKLSSSPSPPSLFSLTHDDTSFAPNSLTSKHLHRRPYYETLILSNGYTAGTAVHQFSKRAVVRVAEVELSLAELHTHFLTDTVVETKVS